MFKVYDAQGNYVFVHHLIDVNSYLKNGYRYYEEASLEEVKKYGPDERSHYISKRDKHFFQTQCGLFKMSECYSTTVSKIPRKNSHFLTVIGTADCVFDDIKKHGTYGDIAVVNDAAFYFPKFDHFVTVHGKLIPIVKNYREAFRSYEVFDYQTHSAVAQQVGLIEADQNNADYLWKFKPVYRSSGLLAIWIGMALGYSAIMVHGITLEERNHFYDFGPSPVLSQFSKLFSQIDNHEIRELLKRGNVRASSGRFSDFVGKVTKGWIDAHK